MVRRIVKQAAKAKQMRHLQELWRCCDGAPHMDQENKMNRHHDWTDSSFARWLRRSASLQAKPTCATSKEWQDWEDEEKRQSPLVHWFIEVFLDRIEGIVFWPVERANDARYYIKNRFIDKTHVLKTGTKPGSWRDLDHQLLYANMQALVDYVEAELAWMYYVCNTSDFQKKYGAKPRWWRPFRCPTAGLDYLAWEATLDQPGTEHPSPLQAHYAREKRAIYHWWKVDRPARSDPMRLSGMSAIHHAADVAGKDFMDTTWHPPEWEAANNKHEEIEARYDAEDEEMLIRLIKIRKGLWT